MLSKFTGKKTGMPLDDNPIMGASGFEEGDSFFFNNKKRELLESQIIYEEDADIQGKHRKSVTWFDREAPENENKMDRRREVRIPDEEIIMVSDEDIMIGDDEVMVFEDGSDSHDPNKTDSEAEGGQPGDSLMDRIKGLANEGPVQLKYDYRSEVAAQVVGQQSDSGHGSSDIFKEARSIIKKTPN
jgi:hypothetical protein